MMPSRQYRGVPSQDEELSLNTSANIATAPAPALPGAPSEIDEAGTTALLSSTTPTNNVTVHSHNRALVEGDGTVSTEDKDSFESFTTKDNDDAAHLPTNDQLGSATISVDEAIERLGMGYFQLIVLTAAGLCFAADAMQILLLSFVSEVLRLEWHLSDDETAFITSILFIGAIFGTLTLGPLADKKGRKPVFLLSAFIISSFGIATALATDYWSLLASLFLVGWGVGGLTVPFDILAEFLPADARGKNLLVIEYFWTVGVLFVVLLAYWTLGKGENPNSWRHFVFSCSVPCWISVLVGYCFVPESPRWLCTQGRCDEALAIIRNAAKVNQLDSELLFPPETQLEDEEEEASDFCELLSPRWRCTTLILWGAWGFFAFGYYGTIMVVTEIFGSEGEPSLEGGKDTYNFDYGAIFVSSSAELVGTTIAILLVDVVGRIPLQVVSYTLAGISVCTMCVSAANDFHRGVLVSLGFSARIFEMIGSCVSWVSTAEILTTDVRTTGHSAANAVARIGSLYSPFLIQGHNSLVKKGLVMLAVHAMTVVCVSQLPETKGSHMGRAHQLDDESEGLVPHSSSDVSPRSEPFIT